MTTGNPERVQPTANAQGEPVPCLLESDMDRFMHRLRRRLEVGAREYGNRSFTRPAADLVDEVQQELEDVCGWSLLLWIRLDRVRGQVESIVKGGEHGA